MQTHKYLVLDLTDQQILKIGQDIKRGLIGVIPTDTIYGVVASAFDQKAVEKLYRLRKRSSGKPSIVLISDINQITQFGINLTPKQSSYLKDIWPNPVSVILECLNPNLSYLHRGTNSLAFRLSSHRLLKQILDISGPIIAPSANFEGETPAETILEAENYFHNQIDFYLDNDKLTSLPSTVVRLTDSGFEIIRQGKFEINKQSSTVG